MSEHHTHTPDEAAAPQMPAAFASDDRAAEVWETLADSAPRRTWLAAERTYLAWVRTGLAAMALAVGIGRLVPALIDASHVLFGLLGVGYAALGVFLFAMGAYRAQRTRDALAQQRPLPPDVWVLWVVTAICIGLAIATVVLIAVEV